MNIKDEKGVTLIILVVTIIVLLILTTVSLKVTLGENGILEKTKKEKQRAEKEMNVTKREEDFLLNKLEVPMGDITVYPEMGDKGIKIGDYVDYKPDTVDVVFNESIPGVKYKNTEGYKKENLKWRILHIYPDQSVDLISENPINSENKIGLIGEDGYNNGVKALNKLCKTMYSNNAHKIYARSINEDDFMKIRDKTAKEYYDKKIITITHPNIQIPNMFTDEAGWAIDLDGNFQNGIENQVGKEYLKKTGIDNSKQFDSYVQGKKIIKKNLTVMTNGLYYNIRNFLGEKALNVLGKNEMRDYWVASRNVVKNIPKAEDKNQNIRLKFGLRAANNEAFGYHSCFYSDGEIGNNTYCNVRVVVPLNKETIFSIGDGSIDNPYIVNF